MVVGDRESLFFYIWASKETDIITEEDDGQE